MKKYPCTLNQFLLLGQVGFIETGMSSDGVVEKLGKPQIKDYAWIHKYDSLELHFDRKSQFIIEVRLAFWDTMKLVFPSPLCAYSYFPDGTTTREELEIYLKLESITYELRTYALGYLTGIRLDSDVFMGFSGSQESATLQYIKSPRIR